MRSIITGAGSYLPEKKLTNHDLTNIVDTSDEWITERTGIKQRYIAADNQVTSDLASQAAKHALEDAGIEASQIELIIVATTTPDRTFPATATQVQANLGCGAGIAFDIQAVCSGFVYALSVANNFIQAGQVKNALVIGAETISRILDWQDRTTCVLFGDGAGAVVLEASDDNTRGILSSHLHADGRYKDILHADGGVSLTQEAGKLRMVGKDVFKHATSKMTASIKETLSYHQLDINELDWLIPHQANARILQAVAKKLHIAPEKVAITVDHHANTSAASIPLALDEYRRAGKVKQGDLVMFEALGGGLTWGSVLVRM